MPSLLPMRSLNLKVIFLAHFILIALSMMGSWSSSSYLFYNCFLIIFLIWSIYKPDNEEPVQLAIVVNGVSIILDVVLLVMCYPTNSYYAKEKFSAAMAILHLITRPFTTIILIKNLEERTGAQGSLTGLFAAGNPQQTSYEDIDRSGPNTSQGGSYNFANAQQI